jgi:hypothetical protein
MEQCLKGKEICNIADKNEGDIKKKKKKDREIITNQDIRYYGLK